MSYKKNIPAWASWLGSLIVLLILLMMNTAIFVHLFWGLP